MGRPLKKSFFGSPETNGMQLVLSYVWLEGFEAPAEGFYVVRQVGTGRYLVTDGEVTGVVKLVDALPDAPGEGVIVVRPYDSEQVEYASKIFNRTVKTFDGNSYKWSANGAEEEGEADLPFEEWTDPLDVNEEDDNLGFTAENAEGATGYQLDGFGSIENDGEFMSFRVLAIYDTSSLTYIVLEGELDEIQALDVMVGGTAIIYQRLEIDNGKTTFGAEDSYGLMGNGNYQIQRIVDITNL